MTWQVVDKEDRRVCMDNACHRVPYARTCHARQLLHANEDLTSEGRYSGSGGMERLQGDAIRLLLHRNVTQLLRTLLCFLLRKYNPGGFLSFWAIRRSRELHR